VQRRQVHDHRRVATVIGHPECHCVELADVKREEWDEHCCWCCCIGLERCSLVNVVVVHCDYSSQTASGEEKARSRKGGRGSSMGEQKKRCSMMEQPKRQGKSTLRRCVQFCTAIYEECNSSQTCVYFYVMRTLYDISVQCQTMT
jgi:hypothetical protein